MDVKNKMQNNRKILKIKELTDQQLLRKGSDDDVEEADGGYEEEGSFEETND